MEHNGMNMHETPSNTTPPSDATDKPPSEPGGAHNMNEAPDIGTQSAPTTWSLMEAPTNIPDHHKDGTSDCNILINVISAGPMMRLGISTEKCSH
eukprot:8627457-Prorocentrum_lima.AAC.1